MTTYTGDSPLNRIRPLDSVALWLAGSQGRRSPGSSIHRVRRSDGFTLVTACGRHYAIWGLGLSGERSLAVPVSGDPDCVNCRRSA